MIESLYMIKYGKEEHLRQIINGSLRFAPSQVYVKMEEELNNKGQGDLLDGKMKIKVEIARMYDTETKELKGAIQNCNFTMAIQDVNDMPIFCLSHYGKEDTLNYEGVNKYKIILDSDKFTCIKKDFIEATHALIILEPNKFIEGVRDIKGHKVISDQIQYYDYNINSLQMIMYLTTGSPNTRSKEMTLTYENRYRHLLCKDTDFEKQQEYRFIILDELIKKPVFYEYEFTSKYKLISLDNLKDGIDIIL